MAIANSILKKFVELTTDPDPEVGYYVYGTAIVNENGKYVKVDGSDSVTSVSLATDLVTGDRVLVYIEGHKASVIGNVTCPASGRTAVDVSGMLEDFSSLVVGALYATYAEIESIRANYVTTEYLEATYATITDLKVVFEDVDILYAGVANIENLLGGEGGFGTLESIHLTVDNAVIDELVVTEAIANNAILGTLLSGYIYTDYITIMSTDGSIEIIGTTMQFTDENDIVRIQIGKDGSGNFTFILYDADGVGIMLDPEGIHESAVPDGLIVDDMVADNAAIRGDKIDMETLTYCLNEYGELELDASRVLIDGSTLDYQLTRINQSIDGILLEGVKDWKLYFAKNASNKSNPNDSPTLQFSSEALVFSGGDGKTGTLTINVAYKEGLTPVGIVSYSEDIEGPLRLIEGPDLNGDVITATYENVYEDVYGTVVLTVVIEYEYEDELVLWSLEEPELNTGEYLWARYWMEKMDDSIEWGIPFLFTDSETRNVTTTLQTELKVVQGQIEAYIYETETAIDELEQSVSETWTVIQENLGEILETVGEMQTTLYDDGVGLVSRMSTVELTANSINESVSSVESWLGDYYSYTESLNTVITQTVEDAKADIMLGVSYEYSSTLKGLENYYAISGSPDIAPPDEPIIATITNKLSNDNTSVDYITFTIEASISGFGYGDINPIHIISYEAISTGNADITEIKINGSGIEITVHNNYASLNITIEIVVEYTTEWSDEYPHVEEGEYLWVKQLITHADNTTEWGTPWCVSDDLSGFASIAYTNAQIELSASQTEASIMSQAEGIFVTDDGWFKNTSEIYQYINDSMSSIELKVTDGKLGRTASITLTTDVTSESIDLNLADVRQAFADDDGTAIEIAGATVAFVSNTLLVESEQFQLDENGNATFSGNLSAPTGTIGGFMIADSSLYTIVGNIVINENFSGTTFPSGWVLYGGTTIPNEGTNGYIRLYTSDDDFEQYRCLMTPSLDFATYQVQFRAYGNGAIHIGTGCMNKTLYRRSTKDSWTTYTINNFEISSADNDNNKICFFVTREADNNEINVYITDIIITDLSTGKSTFSSTLNGVYIGTDGISLGSTFSVNSDGYLKTTSGLIGGFNLDDHALWTDPHTTFLSTKTGVWIGDAGISLGSGFSVTEYGYLTATSGLIGGFTIEDESIHTEHKDGYNCGFTNIGGVYIGTDGIGLGTTEFWVNSKGFFSCTSGIIGNWAINENCLYYEDHSSIDSTNIGAYLGRDGYSQRSSDTAYVKLYEGRMFLGYSLGEAGYISGYDRWIPTNTADLRIAGNGGISLCSPHLSVLDSYPDYSSEITVYEGQSGTITYITSITGNEDGSIEWDWLTLEFKNGIMISKI